MLCSGCMDCPAVRQNVFGPALPRAGAVCGFQCNSLSARETLPLRWFDLYDVALVRRGVVVRQRLDAHGRVVAVDAVGAGCFFPLRSRPVAGSVRAGYAASDALVCLGSIERIGGSERDLLELHSVALDRVERYSDARGRSTVEAQVAALLCTIADTISPPRRRDRIPDGLQQRDLADLLGVRHETVCRALGNLQRSGAIRRDPDGLAITDRAALEER